MGPRGRSGRVRIISTPTGIRSPDRPASSESLYRLTYRGSLSFNISPLNIYIYIYIYACYIHVVSCIKFKCLKRNVAQTHLLASLHFFKNSSSVTFWKLGELFQFGHQRITLITCQYVPCFCMCTYSGHTFQLITSI